MKIEISVYKCTRIGQNLIAPDAFDPWRAKAALFSLKAERTLEIVFYQRVRILVDYEYVFPARASPLVEHGMHHRSWVRIQILISQTKITWKEN